MISLTSVSYMYPHAATPALLDISLHLEKGKLLLCTGQSGCGKSTLLMTMNGLIPRAFNGTLQGDVLVNGIHTRDTTPAHLAQTVGTLFQDPERQFFALTVEDELAVSLQWRGWSPAQVRHAITEAAERMGIRHLMEQTIFGLSEGQKQKVAIASLLAAKPQVLVLDEPSANLDPESTLELATILAELKNDGLALFVVDHRLAWLRNVADSVLVLNKGHIAAQGTYDILDNDALRKANGLRDSVVEDIRETLAPMPAMTQEEAVFSCTDLDFGYNKMQTLFSQASFAFKAGEVVALIGENGVGKTTLARLFTGLEKNKQGNFYVRGKEISRKKLVHHVQVVLQNAGHQLRMQSVEKELADAALCAAVDKKTIPALVSQNLSEYGLTHLAARHPQSLSGGEKQRLAVACATIRQPDVLFLDEPTSGLDGENMERIAASVQKAAKKGAAVVVITHDLELMARICTKKLELTRT